ncbi:hypothetical protein BVRB_2g030110 [Beta vulgaris subsp. vulgaris]|nr:hypothetical protein BVRB_2g030110 [Beta vulgaris subsp. vulgaris]
MHGEEKDGSEIYAILRDAGKGVPAAGISTGGYRKKIPKGKSARRLMQADQDYDYYDFYRKHEDIPSPGIGH